MRRVALFVALLTVFTLWRFPHKRFAESLLAPIAARMGMELHVADVAYAFPLGYTLKDVRMTTTEGNLLLGTVALALGLGRDVAIDAASCSGTVKGHVGPQALALDFDGVDPSHCVDLGGLKIGGAFTGTIHLEAPGRGSGAGTIGRIGRAGRMQLRGRSGFISGTLPGADGNGFALGEWEFRDLSGEATLENGEIQLARMSALSQGIEWQLGKGRLFTAPSGETQIVAEMRARRVDESGRAKAVFGMLPKAGSGRDGWRRYKLTGPLAKPLVTGLR